MVVVKCTSEGKFTCATGPNPSFAIGKRRYISSKTFSDISSSRFSKTQAALDNSFKYYSLLTDGFGTEDK